MSSKRKMKDKQSFWSRLNAKGKMYFVLAVCCAIVFVTSLVAFLVVHGLSNPTAGSDSQSSESMVDEEGYDKDKNTIDTTQYSSTILEESKDAGQEYVDETLFLGDSNTARMYRMFDYCTYDNAIGSVGMSARSLATYECVKFQGLSGYKTMPEAVAIMQPQRVIITFGTNDLSPTNSTDNFIQSYEKGIKAVQEAYPSVDIIINAIPPLGKQHSNDSLTQTQVDEYNQAIVQMCQDNDWKFLNSAEVLKDSSTGYAKSGYVESSDGIHLTKTAMDALFEYIRTHSYITEDDRPTLTTVPEHIEDKDVSASTASTVTTTSPSSSSSSSSASSSSESVETQAPTEQPTAEPTYTWSTEVVNPTCTEQGYTKHICNEDSSKNYNDTYVAALGHTAPNAEGKCDRCGAQLTTPPASSSDQSSSNQSSSTPPDSSSSTTTTPEPQPSQPDSSQTDQTDSTQSTPQPVETPAQNTENKVPENQATQDQPANETVDQTPVA